MYCVWVHFVFQKCTYLFTYLVLECSSLIDYGPCTRPPHFPSQNIGDKHNLTLLTFTTFWHKYINSALLNMISNYNIQQYYYVRHCYSRVWFYVLVVNNNVYKILCMYITISVSVVPRCQGLPLLWHFTHLPTAQYSIYHTSIQLITIKGTHILHSSKCSDPLTTINNKCKDCYKKIVLRSEALI